MQQFKQVRVPSSINRHSEFLNDESASILTTTYSTEREFLAISSENWRDAAPKLLSVGGTTAEVRGARTTVVRRRIYGDSLLFTASLFIRFMDNSHVPSICHSLN